MRVVLTLEGLEDTQKAQKAVETIRKLLNREAILEKNRVIIELDTLDTLEMIDVELRKFDCSILKVESES
ncbi:hypothetical protein [Kosmotoga pacifica]|uniref:HMA domain-containing protein n=1 Tax=Kosmotoga pacifica TaxID=1330330 RepID=A0A0G2Z6Q8_9BACT|nr:hypothetical protein [Kosmotoga pacifica]AKI97247.1 hypothetical protein IX53_04815 [Kosmotoga pacifica]